jgi:hypothetical protein
LFTVSSSCLWGWVCGEGGGVFPVSPIMVSFGFHL